MTLRTYLVCLRTARLTGAKAEAAPRLSKRAKIVRKGAILIAIVGNAMLKKTREERGKDERKLK
jgi:hypothetical protein